MTKDFTSEPAWWEWRATRLTPPPASGRFIGWWRSKQAAGPCILKWDDDGKQLWTDSGVAVHDFEHSFSAWMHCPVAPTVDQT